MIGNSAMPLIAAIALLGLAPLTSTAIAATADGATIFRQRCQACHSPTAAKPSVLAPNLGGVVGRRAASTSFAYSNALKKSGLTWNRETLDRYLTAPGRLVPGTRMIISVPDAAQRAAVIDYLSTAH